MEQPWHWWAASAFPMERSEWIPTHPCPSLTMFLSSVLPQPQGSGWESQPSNDSGWPGVSEMDLNKSETCENSNSLTATRVLVLGVQDSGMKVSHGKQVASGNHISVGRETSDYPFLLPWQGPVGMRMHQALGDRSRRGTAILGDKVPI
jgi:hypothetical protein